MAMLQLFNTNKLSTIISISYNVLLISGRAERSSAANLHPWVRFSLGSKQRQQSGI